MIPALVLLFLSCNDKVSGDDSIGGSGLCPGESCDASAACLATADPAGATSFWLRASQINVEGPSALNSGIVGSILSGGSIANLPECGLYGGGTWNLLLGFDLAAGTLTLASAEPASGGAGPWSPVDGTVAGVSVAPATGNGATGAGEFSAEISTANLAVYLDEAGNDALVFPLRNIVLTGTLSESLACIGHYNAAALEPLDCVSDGTVQSFTPDGTFGGTITLEDADTITVGALNQSLCVLLSGDAGRYGDGDTPSHCVRDENGEILYQGDWCNSTNSSGNAYCADAVHLEFAFAASAVEVNP